MSEQEIELSPIGKLQFDSKQQQWLGNEHIHTAQFAGQQMMLIKSVSHEEVDQYELHYLGLMVSGFTSTEEAQLNAPAFAKSVLFTLDDLIKEES